MTFVKYTYIYPTHQTQGSGVKSLHKAIKKVCLRNFWQNSKCCAIFFRKSALRYAIIFLIICLKQN